MNSPTLSAHTSLPLALPVLKSTYLDEEVKSDYMCVVGCSKLRKKLTKAMEPPVQVEDTGEDEPKAPRSVVTIYLLGWGVAFILCGISAAISWNSYNKD